MEDLSKRFETSVSGTGHMVADKGHELGHSIEKVSQNLGRELSSAVGNAAETVGGTIQSTQDYIESNPKKSLAVAAMAGIAIGSVLTMTLRPRP
jgi:ElaB/YqjD/DUF883 family membrane-anchored ribosome-binding protein